MEPEIVGRQGKSNIQQVSFAEYLAIVEKKGFQPIQTYIFF